MPFRPEFKEALSLLAQAIKTLTDKGYDPPILGGGGAVEFFTGGAVMSGDFDLVTPYQRELEEALKPYGFNRILEPGVTRMSLVHRDLPIAVQVVGGALMDGKANSDKIRLVELDDIGAFAIIPIEDLIADRMGQAFSVSPPREDMLDQALKLFQLAQDLDSAYLDIRICEETAGDANLATLRRRV